jgi:hypothetical protein
MAKIRLPDQFLDRIGHPVAMDLHVIDVKLSDGRRLRKLAVRGSCFITGYQSDKDGESDLDFDSDEIIDVWKSRLWPIW